VATERGDGAGDEREVMEEGKVMANESASAVPMEAATVVAKEAAMQAATVLARRWRR
jgi:hypothetical protein